MRRLYYWGVRPSTWPHLLLRLPCAGGISPDFPAGDPTRAGREGTGPPARSPRGRGAGYRASMDLAYPPEAEEFRTEIAEWLNENLPQGWGKADFSLTPEERKA